MKEYTIDASLLNENERAHDYLKEVFSFPDYYGKNLDALYDCLSEKNIDRINVINSDKGGFYFFAILNVIKECEIEVYMK